MRYILLVLVIFFLACTAQLTLEQAKHIAEQRIMQDYNYRAYDGHGLYLKESRTLGSGYHLTYRYDITDGPANVDSIEVSLIVEDGRASNYTHTELLGADSYIVYYTEGDIVYNLTQTKPTPCHEIILDEQIMESYPEQIRLDIQIRDTGEICAQVISEEQLDGRISLGHRPASVEVRVNDNRVYFKRW